MKRKLIPIIVIFAVLFSSNNFALGSANISIDGVKRTFNSPVLIQRNAAYVPLVDCSVDLGARVDYNQRTRAIKITKGSSTIKLRVESIYGYFNGKRQKISARPKLINKKVYIPVSLLDEIFETKSSFEDATKNLSIDTKEFIAEKIKLSDSQKYQIMQVYKLKNTGDEANIEIEFLLGAKSNSPYQTDEDITVSPQLDETSFDDYDNKYAKIRVAPIKPGQEVQIETVKTLINSGIKYNINTTSLSKEYESAYNLYTKPESEIESDNSIIAQKAKELANGNNTPYDIAKKIYEYVNLHMTYDESGTYARKGALSALQTGRGVCEDYAKLTVALLRANNIPARTVSGIWLQEDAKAQISYDAWTDVTSIAHQWPEFYLKDYGWIICEPTFLYTVNGTKTVPWEQFANQDENGHIINSYNFIKDPYISGTIREDRNFDISTEDIKIYLKKSR